MYGMRGRSEVGKLCVRSWDSGIREHIQAGGLKSQQKEVPGMESDSELHYRLDGIVVTLTCSFNPNVYTHTHTHITTTQAYILYSGGVIQLVF